MQAINFNKYECWLYKEPIQNTCLLDKHTGKISANIFRVPLGEIIYITSFNTKKNFKKFVRENGTEYYRRLSLKEVVNANDNFIFIRKDTIINVSHVTKRCDWLYIWIGNCQFNISRQYRKEAKERFESFIL